MLPTPDTSHVSYDQIYEPSEDSYLLLDTLSSASETSFLQTHFATTKTATTEKGEGQNTPLLAVEVGTGSGVVLAFLTANAPVLLRRPVLSLGLDINRLACIATSETVSKSLEAQKNDGGSGSSGVTRAAPEAESNPTTIFLDCLNADLTTCLKNSETDILIFNPPYVPADLPDLASHERYNNAPSSDDTTTLSSSEIFDRDSHLLALSYAGGVDGMEVTDRLLEQLPRVLSPRGVAYVLLCAQNKPRSVMEGIRKWEGGGWSAEVVGSSGMKAGWEKLVVVRIMRKMRDLKE